MAVVPVISVVATIIAVLVLVVVIVVVMVVARVVVVCVVVVPFVAVVKVRALFYPGEWGDSPQELFKSHRVLQGSFMGVARKFQGCFKED